MTFSPYAGAKTTPAQNYRTTRKHSIGSVLNFDTCGPFRTPIRHGNTYFLTVMDFGSHYVYTIPLHRKAEAKQQIRGLLQHIKATTPHTPILAWSKNAREFISTDMQHTIQHIRSPPHDHAKTVSLNDFTAPLWKHFAQQ